MDTTDNTFRSERATFRREKIRAREALTAEERSRRSEAISVRVSSSPEFLRAKTILLYRAVKGEVQLDALVRAAEKAGKRIAFPRCVSDGEMLAYVPNGPDAWEAGRFGILEPIPEQSELVFADEIDLVVCPCVSFDESGNRLGMGAGFYDRYLADCTHAAVVAVAFEVQKAACIPVRQWDFAMDCVYTEGGEYR